jgi:phage shock protein A
MAQRIWSRVKRIIGSRVIDSLASGASPEQGLHAWIDECDNAYQEAKVAAATYARTLQCLEKEQEQCQRLSAEWGRRAAQGDVTTARQTLAQKSGFDDRVALLGPRIEEARSIYRRLRDDLVQLRACLDDAKRHAESRNRDHSADANRRLARGRGDGEILLAMEDAVLVGDTDVEHLVCAEDSDHSDDRSMEPRVGTC